MQAAPPAEPTDPTLLALARKVRKIVRQGRPWELPELIEREAVARMMSKRDLVLAIERVSDRNGLSDRQVTFETPAPADPP